MFTCLDCGFTEGRAAFRLTGDHAELECPVCGGVHVQEPDQPVTVNQGGDHVEL